MPRYTFIHKSGRITRRTMSPVNATIYGERTKSIKKYGLSSKIVLPLTKSKRIKRRRKR